MQTGTLAALGYPLRRQVLVTASRTLTTQDLNGVIVVDSTAGPVTVTIPDGISIGAGGFFQIYAPRGDVNPVMVAFEPGNTFNLGQTGPILISDANTSLTVLAAQDRTWNVFFGAAGTQAGVGLQNLIYTPGNPGPLQPNEFTDWAMVHAAAAAVQPSLIEIDDSFAPAVVAPGAWDMTGITLGGPLRRSPFPIPVLTVPDGATFTGLEHIVGPLNVESTSGSPIQTVTSTSLIRIDRGAVITSSTAPFFAVSGAGVFFFVSLIDGGGITGSLGAAIVDLAAGTTGIILVAERGSSDAAAISGPAGASLSVAIQSASATFTPPVGPTLTGPPSVLDASLQVNYTAAVAADWGGTSPTNVAEALDRIAALVGPIP